MAKKQSWEVSDQLWEKVQPLVPVPKPMEGKKYLRAFGAGRKPLDPRKVFEGIVYVLRTGCQWKALPKERFGAGSSIHSYFQNWMMKGFFLRLWKEGLLHYDELKGIEWSWQSVDGSMTKAPLAQEEVGRNPTDRGKKRQQTQFDGRRFRGPALLSRQRSQHQ